MSEDIKKRRHYRRTQLAICKLYVSRNETRWMEAKLEDISAGGAKFYLENLELSEEEIFIKINVMSGLTEFTFKTKARIIRKEGNKEAEYFTLVINDTIEVKWWENAHKKDTDIVKIDVENLMKVLRGEPYETYKRKLQNFTYRF
jgi:c-di-GMP-binding flagellar brake protein YcgR